MSSSACTPEFAFEKKIDNVRKAAADLAVGYPVAVDNDCAIWRAFNNQYWLAHYFIDAQDRVRHHHFGEGDYDKSQLVIQQLLAEAGKKNVSSGTVSVTATGAEAASNQADVQSLETYLGYLRAQNFLGPGGIVSDTDHVYAAMDPRRNEWGLTGNWNVGPERAPLTKEGGSIYYRSIIAFARATLTSCSVLAPTASRSVSRSPSTGRRQETAMASIRTLMGMER